MRPSCSFYCPSAWIFSFHLYPRLFGQSVLRLDSALPPTLATLEVGYSEAALDSAAHSEGAPDSVAHSAVAAAVSVAAAFAVVAVAALWLAEGPAEVQQRAQAQE